MSKKVNPNFAKVDKCEAHTDKGETVELKYKGEKHLVEHPDKMPIGIFTAMEFGFKCCEKGMNLEQAFEKLLELYKK